MTPEKINAWRKAAGIGALTEYGKVCLTSFAQLAIEHEREQCAMLAARILRMPENDVSTAIMQRGMK